MFVSISFMRNFLYTCKYKHLILKKYIRCIFHFLPTCSFPPSIERTTMMWLFYFMNQASMMWVGVRVMTNCNYLLGKTQVAHRINKTFDKSLRRWGNPHFENRFCKNELGPKFQNGIWACRIQRSPTYSVTKPKECQVWGGCIGKN